MDKALLLRSWHREPVFDIDDVLQSVVSSLAEQPLGRFDTPVDGAAPLTNMQLKDADATVIGLRLTERLADPSTAAVKILTSAFESGFTPIVISTVPESGFEALGFRVEYAVHESDVERQKLIDQIVAFWSIAFVIDIAPDAASA